MPIYTIPKEAKFSHHPLQWHTGTTAEVRMVHMFNNWKIDGARTNVINKVWGYSYSIDHHYCSARLGCKLFPDFIRLVTYVYDAGVRLRDKKLKEFGYNDAVFISAIDFVSAGDKSAWLFTVDGKEISQPVSKDTKPKSGAFLFPYYNDGAPHKIETLITKI